jgi:hypothetical protein
MKIELTHIAPYLPYGVKIYPYQKGDIFKELHAAIIMLFVDGFFDRKITLRPLSDLIEEVEHNGERFVPILELFKISLGINNVMLSEITYHNQPHQLHFKITNPDQGVYKKRGSFYFDGQAFSLYIDQAIHVSNQLEMFQKLFEWHFDVFGLIEKGLVLDINKTFK